MAESLEWARDFFIFAAQRGDEIQRLREHIERREAARTAIAEGAVTRPVNGSAAAVLAQVRASR